MARYLTRVRWLDFNFSTVRSRHYAGRLYPHIESESFLSLAMQQDRVYVGGARSRRRLLCDRCCSRGALVLRVCRRVEPHGAWTFCKFGSARQGAFNRRSVK